MTPNDLRVLDFQVAEKVMGWERVEMDAYTPYGKDVCGTPPSGIKPMWNTGRSAIPHYSTDIAAAWEVVNKLRLQWEYFFLNAGNGWQATVSTHHFEMKGETITVSWDETINGEPSETEMLAICLCALKAADDTVPPVDE